MMKMNRVRVRADATSSPRPIRRRRGAGAVAMLLATSALAVAGCGSSSSNATTTSAPSGSGGSSGSAQSASLNKAAQYSQCMRAHGVPDFPDPNAQGKIGLKVTKGSDLDPSSAAFKSAAQACKSLQPPGVGAGSQSVGNQNQLLQFVNCMHKNGVPNFPEPSASGAMKITSGSGVDPNSPQFKSAMQTCHKLLPGGGSGAQVG